MSDKCDICGRHEQKLEHFYYVNTSENLPVCIDCILARFNDYQKTIVEWAEYKAMTEQRIAEWERALHTAQMALEEANLYTRHMDMETEEKIKDALRAIDCKERR